MQFNSSLSFRQIFSTPTIDKEPNKNAPCGSYCRRVHFCVISTKRGGLFCECAENEAFFLTLDFLCVKIV